MLIETFAFYWWHVNFWNKIRTISSVCSTVQNSTGCNVSLLSIAFVATIDLGTGSASSAHTAYHVDWNAHSALAFLKPISRHHVQLIKIIPSRLANQRQSKQLFNRCALKWPSVTVLSHSEDTCPQINSHIYYTKFLLRFSILYNKIS